MFIRACRDALLRRLTLRFILCRAALTLHTVAGRNPANLPTVFPELPKEVREKACCLSPPVGTNLQTRYGSFGWLAVSNCHLLMHGQGCW